MEWNKKGNLNWESLRCRKLLEQQEKKQAEEAQKLMDSQKQEKPTVEDMSVDELNSLSAEERRDQMLKALDKRIN